MAIAELKCGGPALRGRSVKHASGSPDVESSPSTHYSGMNPSVRDLRPSASLTRGTPIPIKPAGVLQADLAELHDVGASMRPAPS